MEPIFLRRSVWTTSSLPEFTSEGCDVIMSECGYAVADGSRIQMSVTFGGVLERLPRLLVCRQVILLFLLLRNPMGMRGNVL